MFAQGAAAGAVGGLGKAMMRAGSNIRKANQQAGASGVPSARQYRKILQASVEAHRQFSEIDTEHHGRRIGQQTEATLRLSEAGFHTVRQETPYGKMEAQREPGQAPSYDPGAGATGPDRSYNPSQDVHGHPGAGHVTVHGYTGDVLTLSPSAVKVTPRALEGGKAAEPVKPVFKAGTTGVVKSGSFMDKPEKPQPEVSPTLKQDGAIPMGTSAPKPKRSKKKAV